MSEFKVGDRVIYVGLSLDWCSDDHMGKLGTVISMNMLDPDLPDVQFDDGTKQTGCLRGNVELLHGVRQKRKSGFSQFIVEKSL